MLGQSDLGGWGKGPGHNRMGPGQGRIVLAHNNPTRTGKGRDQQGEQGGSALQHVAGMNHRGWAS